MIVAAPRVTIDEQNPWPGLIAFDEAAERFFNGRGDESAALRRLVVQAPLTVLFGASGLGKTSLVQAGLFPLLRHDHFLPVYVRLDLRDDAGPLIEQVKQALQQEVRERRVDAPAWMSGEPLWDYLHRAGLELWSEHNRLLTPLFAFDQFEEVFTLGASRGDAIGQLLIDLADLIENRMPGRLASLMHDNEAAATSLSLDSQRYKILVSFREDFLPAVEGLKRTVPSIMRNRLRLLPMSGEQAFDAVHKTAPHLVDDAMAWRIVSFVAGAGEEAAERAGNLSVEPALLSLVCRGLNEKRKAQKKVRFDAALLQGTGQAIVADFYRDTVADLPLHVRRFVQAELITERGFRKPCDLDDAIRVHGVSEAHLRRLVDRRLLRIEPVRGTERVELTHDLLTPVVREHRDRDREQVRLAREQQARRRLAAVGMALGIIALGSVGLAVYFETLRETAELNAADLSRTLDELKAEKARADAATLSEQAARARAEDSAREAAALALSESKARADADAKAMEASEQQMLALVARDRADRLRTEADEARSQAEQASADAESAAARERDAALRERDAAEREKDRADEALRAQAEADRLRSLSIAQELAARARVLQRDEDLPLAADMVARAFVRYTQNGCRTAEAPAARCASEQIDANILLALQATFNRLSRRLRAPFGGGIVSADAGGSILQAPGGPASQSSPPLLLSARQGAGVFRIELPPSWRDLSASGGPAPATNTLLRLERRVTAVAIAPGGAPVAAGDIDGAVAVTPNAGWPPHPDENAPIAALAFSRDGAALVSAAQGGILRRIVRAGALFETPLPVGRGGPLAIRSLLFAPEGNAVLVATSEGIFRWDFADPPARVGETGAFDVRSIAFAPDGGRMAFGDRLGVLRLARWTGSALAATQTFDERHASSIDALAFAPGGRLLASAGADGTVRLFPLDRGTSVLPAVFDEHAGRVESVVFADDATLLSGGADRTIRRWLARMDVLATAICRLVDQGTLPPLRASDRAALEALLPAEDDAATSACATLDTARSAGSPSSAR